MQTQIGAGIAADPLSPDFDPLDPPPEGNASAPSGFGGMLGRTPRAAVRLRISVTGVGRDALAGLGVSDLGGQLSTWPEPFASPFGEMPLAAFPLPKARRVSRAGFSPGPVFRSRDRQPSPVGMSLSDRSGDTRLRGHPPSLSDPTVPPRRPGGFLAAPARLSRHKPLILLRFLALEPFRLQEGCCHRSRVGVTPKMPAAACG